MCLVGLRTDDLYVKFDEVTIVLIKSLARRGTAGGRASTESGNRKQNKHIVIHSVPDISIPAYKHKLLEDV